MQNNTKHQTTSTTAYHDYSNSQLNLSNLFDRNSPDSSQNLPKFLFGGENQYQVSSRRRFGVSRTSASMTASPGILKTNNPTSSNSPGQKSVHWSPLLVRERSRSPETRARKVPSSSLWNGPPLRSLTDISEPPTKQARPENSQITSFTPDSICENPRNGVDSDALHIPDLENSTIPEDEAICWVTVFGFPHEESRQILDLFSRHGAIVAKKVPRQGNWMNIRYSSPVHARQALSKNATLYKGIMIGVVPCKDLELSLDLENFDNGSQSAVQNVALNRSFHQTNMDLSNGTRMTPSVTVTRSASTYIPGSRSRLSTSTRIGMRPLNASSASDIDSSMNLSTASRGTADDSLLGKIWSIFTNS